MALLPLHASVVQWQNGRLPPCIREFDSPYSLQRSVSSAAERHSYKVVDGGSSPSRPTSTPSRGCDEHETRSARGSTSQ